MIKYLEYSALLEWTTHFSIFYCGSHLMSVLKDLTKKNGVIIKLLKFDVILIAITNSDSRLMSNGISLSDLIISQNFL